MAGILLVIGPLVEGVVPGLFGVVLPPGNFIVPEKDGVVEGVIEGVPLPLFMFGMCDAPGDSVAAMLSDPILDGVADAIAAECGAIDASAPEGRDAAGILEVI